MNGSGSVRFSELFADTIETHGVQWAHAYYTGKHAMQAWEFSFWFRTWAGREFEGIGYYR